MTTATVPSEIRESDLPPTFQTADQWAIDYQNHHLRFVKAHVLFGVVGASVMQMAFSLSNETGFVWAIVICVLALLVTRVLVQRRPYWERVWCRSRAAAEQVRSLSWIYMMGVMPESKAETAGTIRRIREEWSQAVNAGPLPPVTAGEVTRQMEEIRGIPHTARVKLYLQGRVNDQIHWYHRKAGFNRVRKRVFLVLAILCELAAAGIAIAMWVHLAKRPPNDEQLRTVLRYLLTFIWPCLTGASAASGWASFKRYAELAGTYQRSAEQLDAIRRDIERLAEDSTANKQAFAQRVHECEDVLTRENAIWFTRREA